MCEQGYTAISQFFKLNHFIVSLSYDHSASIIVIIAIFVSISIHGDCVSRGHTAILPINFHFLSVLFKCPVNMLM